MQSKSLRSSASLTLAALVLCGCGLLEPFTNALTAVCEQDLLIVNKFEDTNDGICTEDDCSLREAVITSNDCEGTQTIRIPNGTYYLTIEGQNEADSARGDLNIRDAVIIEGLSNPVIDGSGIDRVISISLLHASDEARLSNLTIRNGSGGPGAGIFDIQGELFLLDTEVRSNTSSRSGGGIYATSGALDIRRSTIASNTANGDGGGIFISTGASLHLYDNSVLEQNRSLEGYSGGGLFNQSSTLSVIEDATLQDNTSSGLGGGLYNDGLLSVRRSRIEGNSATTLGGAIATTSAGFEIEASRLVGNQAPSGGGIAIQPGGVGPATPVQIQSTLFDQNQTSLDGGQIFSTAGVDLRVHDSDFLNGRARYGGAIYNLGNLSVVGTTFSGNQASVGGAIYNRATARFEADTFDHNRAEGTSPIADGAVIYAEDALTVLENSTISGNETVDHAGSALFVFNGEMQLTHITLTGTLGNAIGWGGPPTIHVRSSILVGNSESNCVFRVISEGLNLFESPAACMDLLLGDLDLARLGGDVLLGTLADNGGPTWTHALLPGSPALDAAGIDCLAIDQRGVLRPQGTACDIGAFELEDDSAAVPLSGELPEVIIERDTLCFAGPGAPYPVVGSLLQGSSALVRGIGALDDWLVIDDPRLPSVNCWVNRGDVDEPEAFDRSSLKVFAVPPLPTPTSAPEKAVGCLVFDYSTNDPNDTFCEPHVCTGQEKPGGTCTP
jgi:CSLREA domain-containing protein